MDISHRSDHELLADVSRLVASHRELTAKLVTYLAEIEERRLHLRAGFSSMFEFCVKELGLSEGEAFRRILAARLGRRFPIVRSLIATGAVHLSGLELVRDVLTDENHGELLEAISWKSKRKVEELLAARFPRASVPSKIHAITSSPTTQGDGGFDAHASLELALGSRVQRNATRSRVEPLSEVVFRVEFTASAELRRKLELCRDLMSHANPGRDLGVVVERAMDLLLADLEKKRFARTKRPRSDPGVRCVKGGRVTGSRPERVTGAKLGRVTDARPGRVSNAVRRAVFERDGARCTYVSANGRRCDERAFLELDHIEPKACGGSDHASNLRVRCRAHNQLWAEEVYGREEIARCRNLRQQKRAQGDAREEVARRQHLCQQKWVHGDAGDQRAGGDELPANLVWSEALQKAHKALTNMGFTNAEARAAVDDVQRTHSATELSLEHALRDALRVATATAA